LATNTNVALSTSCGTVVHNGNSSAMQFDPATCGSEYTTQTLTCANAQKDANTYTFTYTLASTDKSGMLFFQVTPDSVLTSSNTKFHIDALASCGGTFCQDYKQSADTGSSTGTNNFASPIVSFIDAKTLRSFSPTPSTVSFTVSCWNDNEDTSFTYALWASGMTLIWETAVSTDQTTYGPMAYFGVPCCGPAESWLSLNGEATSHYYIDAEATVISGAWASATLWNAGGGTSFLPLTVPDIVAFGGTGVGGSVADMRTCLSNQSCTTVADKYYISANTKASNDGEAWASVQLRLRSSAGAVAASIVTIAAVAFATLF